MSTINLNGYTINNLEVFKQFLTDNLQNFDSTYPQQFNACIDDLLEQDSVHVGFYELLSSETISHHAKSISYTREDIEDEDGNFTTIITF